MESLPRHGDHPQHRSLGLPVSISCSSPNFPEQPENGYNLTLDFKYELAVVNPNELMVEVTNQDIPFLEYSILQMLARAIHVRPCDLPAQDLDNAAVIRLSSIEPDTVDSSVRKYCSSVLLPMLLLFCCCKNECFI